MTPQNRIFLVATLILASATGGCSFAFVNGPPPNHRQLSFFGCTSGNTIPTLDAAVSALAVVDAVLAGSGQTTTDSSTGSRKGDVITFAATAALLGASAAYGYKKTAECRDAEAELVRRTPPTPIFVPSPYRPPVPYDPWVPHPAVAPVAPAAPPAAAAPAAAPPASRGSPWDSANPAQ
jgi:hypothetical protein